MYSMLAGSAVAEYHRLVENSLAVGQKGCVQKDFLPNADFREPMPGVAISTRLANLRKCWIRKRINELWKPPLSLNARFEDVYRQVLDEAAAIAKGRSSPLTSEDVAGVDADESTDGNESEDGED